MNDRTSPSGQLIDLSDMTPSHVRYAMGWLGYELPATMSPADTAAAMALLQELPADALAVALNPGMRVEFSTPLPSPAIPESVRYNGGLTTTASVEASLSSVQVRPGFDPQHTFEASVELTGGWSVGAGRSDLNRIVRAIEKYAPDWVEQYRETIDRWPRTRDFARGADWMKGGFDYESFEGGRLSYEAVVPPAVAARIDAGDIAAVPNPLRPMEMPIGSSVVITGESLAGSTTEFTYKLLRDTTDTIRLEGRAFGITRIDENIVELTTGPVAAVEHGAYQGVGMTAANLGVQRSERYEGGELDVVRLDLSTPEGQTAYSTFMRSGTLPETIGPGVVEVATRLMIAGEAELSGRGNFLGGSVSGADPTEFDKTLTRFSDGTSEQRATLVGASNGVGFDIVQRYDREEQPVPGSREWTLLLEGVSGEAGAHLKGAYSGQGYDPNMPDGAYAELRFSDEELMRLRDQAREILRVERPETYAYIEANRHEAGIGDRLLDSGDFQQRLAAANTPEEVFMLGFQSETASVGEIAAGLREMSLGTQNGQEIPPPGRLEIRSAALEPLFVHPPAETAATVGAPSTAPAVPDVSPELPTGATPFGKERAIDPAELEGRPRSNFLRATEAVGTLDLPAPFADEQSRQRIAACATAHACEQSMTIDHLMLSRATGQMAPGEKLLLVQGAPQDPACRVESLTTAVAARTPVDDSLARIERQQTQTPLDATNPALAVTQGQESPATTRR